MLRLRRNPAAGALLLALLVPLLAAGPGMPCADMDGGHHSAAGHGFVMGQDGPIEASAADGHAAHGSAHDLLQAAGAVPANGFAADGGDDTRSSRSTGSCAMGMVCSGTVLGPPLAVPGSTPVVHELAISDATWTLHTSDLSLPRRPPRA